MSSPNAADNTPGNAPERGLGSSSRASERLSGVEIAEIEARAAAATPGTWSSDPTGTVCVDADLVPDGVGGETLPFEGPSEVAECYRAELPDERAKNAAFIAAARTDVPRLVAALRAAYAQLRDYESAICFEVTCTGCAGQLDALATAEVERDQAKAELAEYTQHLADGPLPDDVDTLRRYVQYARSTARYEQAGNEKLRSKAAELRGERDRAQAEVEQLNGQLHQMRDLSNVDLATIAELRGEIKALTATLASLRAAVVRAEQATRVVVVLDRRRSRVYSITTDDAEAQRHVRELVAKYDGDPDSASMTAGVVGEALADVRRHRIDELEADQSEASDEILRLIGERDQAKAAERKRAADIVTARAERFAERDTEPLFSTEADLFDRSQTPGRGEYIAAGLKALSEGRGVITEISLNVEPSIFPGAGIISAVPVPEEGPGPVSTALALAASAILHHDEEGADRGE